jgi:phage baseplate assembly protein W
MDRTGFSFPFRIDEIGQIGVQSGDENIRSKIYQILLTAPGERVQVPEFGCGLRDLVFDPNNEILAATTEFTVRRSLLRWLGDEIIIEDVSAKHVDEHLEVAVTYLRRDRLERSKVKIAF